MKRVAIIGGGFAGLAAGVELAARGFAVMLFEARPRLGGRAYSFRDDETGEVVDNGQHALMGCYRDTLAFLDRIGATHKLTRQRNLCVHMVHPEHGPGAIACATLPSPLHLLSGILRYPLLTRGERLRALLGGTQVMAMRRRRDPRLAEWTVAHLLTALRQSPNARASFWYPVAVATLNESPKRAAAAPFAEVLARAFFRSRADSQFVLPKVGLSDLYTDDARRYIEARGGRVELKSQVADLVVSENQASALRLRDGAQVEADACISAVPPKALAALLPDAFRNGGGRPAHDTLAWHALACDAFESSPIVSVHLWFDRPVLADAFVGLIGTTTQWLFNRSLLTGNGGNGAGRQCLSAVISAGRELVDWPTAQIVATVLADLRTMLPPSRAAQVLQSVVVKEKHATISATPAAERLRPAATTPIGNLFLAGDWTSTGLPPTIESAVFSGRRAAELVAEYLGVSDRTARSVILGPNTSRRAQTSGTSFRGAALCR
jgi:squalene-associated FAD-dependent desaturase